MKLLIIRFSSFGDIVQAMGIVDALAKEGAEVHWATRKEFVPLVSLNANVKKVWGLNRQEGYRGLLRLGAMLKKEEYSIVYDAHSSIRSLALCKMLGSVGTQIIRRSKQRWRRFLLFYLRKNTFPHPYKGIYSYREPLLKIFPSIDKIKPQKWNFPESSNYPMHGDEIILCPGAAWEMKKWPLSHWKELIRQLGDIKLILLGGAKDFFCEDLRTIDPDRVVNMAGKLSLEESCHLISRAPLVIAADTGLIHVADVLGVPGIVLMGPTAFGFPSGKSVTVMEKELSCRPCTKDGRGRCSQIVWQKCMVEINPQQVADMAKNMLQLPS